jgi:copper(I)-binding protein
MSAQEGEDGCDLVYLFNGWARSTVEGAPNGAAFGILVNLGAEADTLVSARTDAAEAVELHEMVMGDNDVMQMRPVEGGFVIAPNGYVQLQPGGYHIMLINLSHPLEAGEMLDLTLEFELAGEVSLSVPIRDVDAMDGEMSHDMEGMDESTMPAPMMEWSAACAALHVVDAWARPAAAGMPNSAAYMLLLNLTESDETLVSASTDVAEAVELHEVVMGENDMMQMRPVEGGIAIPAGSATLLQPGGLHVMLINLAAELQVDDTLDLTLTFTEHGDVTLTIPIREPEEGEM